MKKAILGPYPPPYRGVELVVEGEFKRSTGDCILIGTSYEPQKSKNLVLVKRGRFIKNCPELLLNICKNRKKISHIEAHYATTFGLVAFFSRKLFGIKYDVVCHGSDIFANMQNPLYKFLNKLALKNAGKIFAVSNELRNVLIAYGFEPGKIEVRKNKVDNKLFRKLKVKKKNQIIFAGGIQESKGLDLLIESFSRIEKKFPAYKLIIVGRVIEEGYHEKLKNLVKAKNLHGKVVFLGEKKHSEVSKLLNESKLFVMPSKREGYGLALAEALACKVPSVASNIPSLGEIAKGKNCILVNLDADELKEAMEKQLSKRAK